MPSISWLHLTDLHMGMSAQRLLWPDVKEDFFRDLDALHAKSGPWDLVLFTGDLTQQGNEDDFKKLSTALEKLWVHLAKLGSKPALIAVPGNHDLVRPDATLAPMQALKTWHTDAAVRERFWSDAASPERAVVSKAFEHYTRFTEEFAFPAGFEVKRGRVPGDLSVSITRPDGLRMAVVGLNTALLHLWGGDLTGTLTVEREQLFDVCGDDPPEWLSEHHVALLLTHHPKAWLHPRAVDLFEESVLGRDRFFAHLYGHMHEARWERSALGGAPERRVAQGPSLFGLEHWGTAKEKRIHGYMAGRITIEGDRGECRVWPRQRERMVMAGGHYKIIPAYEMDLTDEAVVTHFTARTIARAPTPPPPPVVRASPPPPPSGPSPEYTAAKTLNALDDDAFARALEALGIPADVTSAEPSKMQKAKRVARYLRERGRLAEVETAAMGVFLRRYFGDAPRIRMLLRDAGVNTAGVPFDKPAHEIWAMALAEAKRDGLLRRVMELACEEHPHASVTGSPVLFGSGAAMYRWAVGANSFAVLAVVVVFVGLVAVMVFGGVVGGLFLPMVSIGSTLAIVVVGAIATDTPRLVASTIGGCAMVAAAYGTPLTAVALGVSRLGPSWASVAMVAAVCVARSVSSPESVSIYQDGTHVRS